MDELVQCPYDKNHMVRSLRLPFHMVKCREKNPKVAKALVTCPYNARHRIPKQELDLHVASCESKVSLDFPPAAFVQHDEERWQMPPCEENWDADMDGPSQKSTFVLKAFGPSQPFNGFEENGTNENFQEKAVNTYNPLPPNANPWCRQRGGTHSTAVSNPLTYRSTDVKPRTKEQTFKDNPVNTHKPLAANANPWCGQRGGTSSTAVSNPLTYQSSEEWPSLEHGKNFKK